MADVVTNYAAISSDAVSYWLAQRQITIAERRLVVGQFATKYNLPQRLGKTLRVDRWQYFSLPTSVLSEGTPPDAVSLGLDVTNVTVEQWGIVALLTDVAQVTTAHPVMTAVTERIAQAMEQVIEREMVQMLLGGTNVRYGAAAASRAALDGTKKLVTSDVIAMTTFLRSNGAPSWEGDLMSGVMPPQVEGDIVGSDSTFQQAQNFANVRALQYGEIGIWMGVRWVRGNFLPIYKGQGIPVAGATSGTLDAGTFVAGITAVDGGGTMTSGSNYKFAVVFRDKTTNYERHITQPSANVAAAATGNNESFTITVSAASIVNYVYDVYVTAAGGSGSLFKSLSNQTALTATVTTNPAGTEATCPAPPAATKEVFVGWVFGRDAFGRVELDGMSLASYITPDQESYANPLRQGRKVGSKLMFKSWILDNNFFIRFECNSGASANLPTG